MEAYRIGNAIGNTLQEAVSGGAFGYLAVWAFTPLNPWAGFAFGATYSVAGKFVDPFFNQEQSNFASRLVGTTIKAAAAAGVVIGTGLATVNTAFTIGTSVIVLGPLALAGGILAAAVTIVALAYLFGGNRDLQDSLPPDV